jgi:hypothetical protein
MSYKRSKPDLAFAMPAVFLFISLQAAGDEGLALAPKPSKPAFTTREAISFVVTVTNNAANPVSFFVMSYLGSSSIGKNEYLLRDAKGDAWEMVNNPRAVMPGAPAMARKVDLGTGKSFSSRIVLPGFGNLFRKSGDKLAKGARHLPVGRYTLKVKVTPIKSAIEAGPVEFQVTAAPPPLANPPGVTGEQALTAAKAHLAKRLQHYKDANRGKEPWDSLSVDSFKEKTSSSAKYWSYRFEADLKKRKQTLMINIVVDGKGNVVSRNQGFAIYQKGPPPPPGLRVEPTVPR